MKNNELVAALLFLSCGVSAAVLAIVELAAGELQGVVVAVFSVLFLACAGALQAHRHVRRHGERDRRRRPGVRT